jgi:hypothetical protein
MVFSSALYGYSVGLPVGWSVSKPATVAWTGTGAPDHDSAFTDLFQSTTGTLAWALAAPTQKSLVDLTAAQSAADAREHPCPPTPDVDDPITVSDEPARFTVKDCGILVAMTAVIRDGTGYIFYFQHPPTAKPSDDDVAVFRTLLSRITLP